MKTFIQAIALIFILGSCTTGRLIHYSIQTKPLYLINPAPQKILILNTYNIPAQNFRENKDKLFITLLDTMLSSMETEIRSRSGVEVEVIHGLSNLPVDSAKIMMANHGATHLFAITSFNAFFDQTRVEVTKTDKGKDREAFYDIVSEINYYFCGSNGEPIKTLIRVQRFHSSRSVISGLLAAGPNIVTNSSQASEMTAQNLQTYLYKFFPANDQRDRILYTSKDFSGVGAAINAEDYKGAFEESLRLSKVPDNKIASKAFYNCAVFAERNNQPYEARKYLQQSMEHFKGFFSSVPEAIEMMKDYP